MKTRLYTLLLVLLLAFTPMTAKAAAKVDAKQLIVYNWSEYIPQSVLDDFTKETGVKVVYSTFESNEAMYAKVKLMRGKGYDVIVPSGYFVDLLRRDKLIQPLDIKRISNLGNIDPQMLNQLPNDATTTYSIPYMWGALGLAYNSKFIPEGSLTKWADLPRPEYKGKIILTDDLRDAFGLALKATGSSTSVEDEPSIAKAYEFLKNLKTSVRIFDVTATKQALIGNEVWLGPIWNGDYLVAKEENKDLRFIFPEEGAILWVDNFVIPSGATNVDNAYLFINYMLRPDIAKRCVEEYKYSTPNLKALELLEPEMRQNPILVPGDKELKNAEYPGGVGPALHTYEKYWEMLKTHK